jgi:hypothetical protein
MNDLIEDVGERKARQISKERFMARDDKNLVNWDPHGPANWHEPTGSLILEDCGDHEVMMGTKNAYRDSPPMGLQAAFQSEGLWLALIPTHQTHQGSGLRNQASCP